jgi:DnaA family protein
MKQLVLDLHPDRPPTLDNFVPGANGELLAALARLAEPPASSSPPPHLYLWGAKGSGRTHLLQATVARARERGRPAFGFSAADIDASLPPAPAALIAIDNIETLAPEAQIALFNAFNRARNHNQTLLLTGPDAPLRLALREDLRTRIGQSLIFEARPLDDDTRAAILRSLAARRGLALSGDVLGFMLSHGPRDLPSLVKIFAALDSASLEYKRPITLPLLRELKQQGLPF